MLNLKTLAAADTGTIELRNGDDTPLLQDNGRPCTITVYGPGSKQSVAAEAVRQRQMMAIIRRRGEKGANDNEAAEMNATFLAAVTHSSEGVGYEDLDGPAMYQALYRDPQIRFIADQVLVFQKDWANFSKGSVKS